MNVDGILNPPHNFGADVFKEEVDFLRYVKISNIT